MAAVTLNSVGKQYPNGTVAVRNVSLEIPDGEFLVLVGPSGCGKSTLLRMVAGLEEITEGEVIIGGRVVNDENPKDRDIAMVFQNYALYPHMTVRRNIGYALRLARVPKAEIDRQVDEVARILELAELLDNKPAQLSGGQRQRVAMGRAIIREPAVYLMDEPLSNLDAQLRVQTRAEITKLQARLGVTTIYVTHDQVEAMTMGTRVAVLKGGVIQQVDAPQGLYDRPANLFVATFIGSPSMNLYHARLNRRSGGGTSVRIDSIELELPASTLAGTPQLESFIDQDVVVGVRPEAFFDPELVGDGSAVQSLTATVELVEALGADLLVHAAIDARAVAADGSDPAESASGASAEGAGRAPCHARLTPRSQVRAAERIRLGVDVGQLHFFDPATGTRIQGRR
jgi:multiple sugar transport system ATP-binding protein